MNDNPWENGTSLPLDEKGMSIIAHRDSPCVGRQRVRDAYTNKVECTFVVSNVKGGFTAANRTVMYDLKGVSNASLNVTKNSEHTKLLRHFVESQAQIKVTFLPTVYHIDHNQYEGHVAKIVEFDISTGGVFKKHVFISGPSIEASVKSIFSKVYSGVPEEKNEPQVSTPTTPGAIAG